MDYPKIKTLFKRDADFKLKEEFSDPAFYAINYWRVTEKIDGTNVRIHLSNTGEVEYKGRTDEANLHPNLITYLSNTFTPKKMQALWLPDKENSSIPYDIIIYGEGYGPKIQNGGQYRTDMAVILFDVLVDNKYWLPYNSVAEIAMKLNVEVVPTIDLMQTQHIVEYVKGGHNSLTALLHTGNEVQAEGIVAKPLEPLFNRKGEQVLFKLKYKDFRR